MKQTFLVFVCLSALGFCGCGDPGGDTSANVVMTIRNESSYDLSSVTWAGLRFVTSGQDGDFLKGTIVKAAAPEDASGYIYFTRKDGGIALRTQTIATPENTPVTLNDNTVVVEIGNNTNRDALSQIEQTAPAAPVLTWSGPWVMDAPNAYHSNPIGSSAETWEKLTISTPSACTITVNLSSSSRYDAIGYASYLDGSPSPSQYRLRVYGTSYSDASGTCDYAVPAGTHYIHFGYVKNYSDAYGQDRIYVSATVK
jgi:hypothetical protein